MAVTLPAWWSAAAGLAFAGSLALMVVTLFPWLRAGDLERHDDSRALVATFVLMYVWVGALAMSLAYATSLHADPTRHPMPPGGWVAVGLVALATGGLCAAMVGVGIALGAAAVHTWAEWRRTTRHWTHPRRVLAAWAVACAAGLLERLLLVRVGPIDQDELNAQVVHLIRLGRRFTRAALTDARRREYPGEARQLLAGYADAIDAGLDAISGAIYDRGRYASAAADLRRLAGALQAGSWAEAVRMLGSSTQQRADARRERRRACTVDVTGLLIVAGFFRATFALPVTWFSSAQTLLMVRWGSVAAFAVLVLNLVRHAGWGGRQGGRTLEQAAAMLVSMIKGR